MLVRLPQINIEDGEIEEVMINTDYIIHASAAASGKPHTEVAIDQRGNALLVWIEMSYDDFATRIDEVQR